MITAPVWVVTGDREFCAPAHIHAERKCHISPLS
jgi:hypothetical protein